MLINRLRLWLGRIPIQDALQQQQASFFQTVLIGWIILINLGFPLTFLRGSAAPPGAPPPEALLQLVTAFGWLIGLEWLMLWLSPITALVLLRRGRFTGAVLVATWGLLFGHSIATIALGVTDASVHVLYQIPIALAGLLAGRRMLLAVSGYSILFVLLVGFLQIQDPPLSGFLNLPGITATRGSTMPEIGQLLGFFVAVTILITLLFDRFGGAFRNVLNRALERERELELIRGSLETTVSERTGALEQALHALQRQAADQAALIAENELQRDLLREMSVPVLPVSQSTLIMPLVGALDKDRLHQIREQALSRLATTHAHRLLIDITGVPMIDTQVALGLIQVVEAARLLGADVILVGIRPEVAQSIVGLGIDLRSIHTHVDLQHALAD